MSKGYDKVRDYTLKLLSIRPRSKKEIKKRLENFARKKELKGEVVDKVIADLVSLDLINDNDFVKWWVEQRDYFRPKGSRLIKYELSQKGVSRSTIDKVFESLENREKVEYQLAEKIIKKKLPSYKSLAVKKKKLKVKNLLARRGFSWNVIYKIIDSLD